MNSMNKSALKPIRWGVMLGLIVASFCPAKILAFSLADRVSDVATMKSDAVEIVNKLRSGDYEGVRSNFDESLKSSLSASQIRQGWETVISHIGAYNRHGDPYYTRVDDSHHSVVVRCEMERGAVAVQVYFNDGGKVVGLWLRPTS
jgi:hypothetical protein